MKTFDRLRIYLKQGNITFSQHFVDLLRSEGVFLTRRNKLFRSGIVINHGNSEPIEIGRKVRQFYIINQPEYIQYCSNKLKNYNTLKDFYPETYTHKRDVTEYPVMAKPLSGHHGYGITKINNRRELREFRPDKTYIYQRFIPIKHEFRFNILDREVYQVSHKERIEGETEGGGFVFSYRSLGSNAKISDKFWNYIDRIISKFHNTVGYNLGHYAIDVMKGTDNEYYLSEINSACGIGEFTLDKLLDLLENKYYDNDLEEYRVR